MSEKILVPELGESITEATISKWLKNKGEHINADEPVVELETDKVNLEVPSPIDGTLSEINFKDGDTVKVGAVLGTISDGKGEAVKIEKKPSKWELDCLHEIGIQGIVADIANITHEEFTAISNDLKISKKRKPQKRNSNSPLLPSSTSSEEYDDDDDDDMDDYEDII